MSHKIAKRLRQQKRMQEKQEQYSIQHLEQFIKYHLILTGAKPKVITLTDSFYNWYIQEAQRFADTLNLKPGFKDDAPVFLGVKLEKQSPIITPTN